MKPRTNKKYFIGLLQTFFGDTILTRYYVKTLHVVVLNIHNHAFIVI